MGKRNLNYYRKFEGKKFYWHKEKEYTSKIEANKIRDQLKKEGYNVRVVSGSPGGNVSARKIYRIYKRKK